MTEPEIKAKVNEYITTFEQGCSHTMASGRAEDCSICVRVFIEALRRLMEKP